jgi:hypothetical protein
MSSYAGSVAAYKGAAKEAGVDGDFTIHPKGTFVFKITKSVVFSGNYGESWQVTLKSEEGTHTEFYDTNNEDAKRAGRAMRMVAELAEAVGIDSWDDISVFEGRHLTAEIKHYIAKSTGDVRATVKKYMPLNEEEKAALGLTADGETSDDVPF